ncbi:cytochrome c peroxidase [Sphaerotilus sp.]|uniref:cytochrome-c peroxidase n=1 Tax=Sphaerotilus sp. TaxID=2093942 RepID=UPI00286E4108|nr:cytochrome c peroxidase [Sphaerotilus sp.]
MNTPLSRLFQVLATASVLHSPVARGATTPLPLQTPTRVTVGEQAFNDKSLSAAGNLACASCHTTATAHADPAGTFLPLGGPGLNQQGSRSSPSLAYLATNKPFRLDVEGRPHGGFFWDGRSNTLRDQAGGPLLNPTEMANTSMDEVVARLARAPYFADFTRLYKVAPNASNTVLFDTLRLALATYETGDTDYQRFNSKFDRVLDGKARFSVAEARGLGVFNDARKGNCASCHTSAVGADGSRPLFTNFTYHALGLPRNKAIQANRDPNFHDLGVCGPTRTDLTHRVDLCGKFKVPTLRNIALTGPYFHNATASTLEQAISFYATRDTDPARWYPLVNQRPDRFNDMPLGFRGNVTQTPPFGTLPGNKPRLTQQDTADLAAFLRTLTDDVNAPAGSPLVANPVQRP